MGLIKPYFFVSTLKTQTSSRAELRNSHAFPSLKHTAGLDCHVNEMNDNILLERHVALWLAKLAL